MRREATREQSLIKGNPIMATTKKTTTKTSANRKQGAAAGKKATKTSDKMSALDAAAKILADADSPMSCQELIEAMATKGYWSSTNGKTPANTLYSAILREIGTRGKEARFKKAARGKFGLA